MINVIIEQNEHWERQISAGIKRDKLEKLVKYLDLRQIITITGIRRCGKSTLLRQIIEYLIKRGENPKNILFLNLEHTFFIPHKHNADYLNEIFDEYLKIANPKGKIYFLMDEVQYFDNWQVFVKNKYEKGNIKFILTGSNSSLLSSELSTLLSGRSLNIHLSTFNFKEFLRYKGIEYSDEVKILTNRIDIERAFDEYLKWGGFFEVFRENSEQIKREILANYVKSIIYHDIIPRYEIRHYEDIENLFFYLVSNTGTLLNYTSLSKSLKISDKTIKEYIRYFKEAFLLNTIDKFHNKIKEQIKSQKKVYIEDIGFVEIGYKTLPDATSRKFENFFYNHLKLNHSKIYYLRNKYEVDFFDSENLYQLSYKMESEKAREREVKSLGLYMNELNKKSGYIVTYKQKETLKYQSKKIKVLPIFDFIFEDSNSM